MSSAKLFCQILRQDFLDSAQLRPWSQAYSKQAVALLDRAHNCPSPPRHKHCWEVSKRCACRDRLICGTGWGAAAERGTLVSVSRMEHHAMQGVCWAETWQWSFESKPSFSTMSLIFCSNFKLWLIQNMNWIASGPRLIS